MSYKPYPRYKQSGIVWIGDIPEHWDLATVGRLNTLGRGRVISNLEIGANGGEYPVYSSQTENDGIMGYLNTYDFEGEYVTWTTDGANAGTVFYRRGKFNCTNVCGTIQPKNWDQIDLRYLPYLLNLGTKISVRLDINPKLMNNMMAKIPLLVPPKEEQTAITNFLDEKTAQIDKLISNKQNLIGLLKEERTAVINQAVTKGIDPNIKLTPSGIDWLGDIPEHWEVKKLRYVGNCQNGISKGADYFGSGFPFLSYGDVYKNEELPLSVSGLAQSTDDDRYHYSVEEADVLFTRTSETVEEIGIASTCMQTLNNSTFSGFLIRFRPHKNILHKGFSKYYFRSQIHRAYFVKEMNLVTRASLSQDLLKNLPIVIPPIDEQLKVFDYLENETKRMDITVSKIEKEIELLQEYRTALISEVVTGKIKVI
jgi:type I restriction enzyme S subunit